MSSVKTKVSKDKGPGLDEFAAQRKSMNVWIALVLGVMVVLVATAGIWLT
ncbi:MAG: hypothetical protein VX730_01215 [Pseudomonadota bacterium]|nr:hypothetical protein [Pseudomonadota bacterium]